MGYQVVVLLLFIAAWRPCAAQLGNVTYEPRVQDTPEGMMCPTQDQLQTTRNEIQSELLTIYESLVPAPVPTHGCGGTGWTRVVFINMTDPNQQCPSGLALTTYSKRTCGRTSTSANRCDSTYFDIGGMQYSRVCGRIVGYQFGDTGAFILFNTGTATTIESPYVEGISLTHGPTGARQHIWTFAAGYSDSDTRWPNHLCPCSTASTTENVMVPPFVGNDYFCECGLNAPWGAYIFYADDPLWDGENCGTYGTVCCELNNPPWFIKTLPSSTSDNIELRLCYENSGTGSDVPLELIELYVQ